ncbi:MAG: hypothetical protein ACFE9Z_15305 [Promethearchaeota archaeon]
MTNFYSFTVNLINGIHEANEVGNKAANLSKLIQNKFLIPGICC